MLPIKRFAYVALTGAGMVLLAWWLRTRTSVGELRTILQLLPGLSRPWLATAIVLQALFVFWQSLLFRQVYMELGYDVPLGRLFAINLVSGFVGHVAPVGTAATVVTFVGVAKREGLPSKISVVANGLFYFFDYAGFGLFLGYSLAFLRFSHFMQGIPEFPLTVVLLALIAVVVVVGLAVKNPHTLTAVRMAVSKALARIPGRLGHKASEGLRGFSSVDPIALKIRDLSRRPRTLAAIMASSCAIDLSDVLILYSVVRATGARMGLGALATAFTLGTAMSLLTFIPNGAGVYVVSLWAVLARMGLDIAVAGTVAMVYRAATFWLPAVAGLFVLRYLRKPEDRKCQGN